MDICPAELHRLLQEDLTFARSVIRQRNQRQFEDNLFEEVDAGIPGDGNSPEETEVAARLYACDVIERTLLKKLEPKETSEADAKALTKWLEKNLETLEWTWRPQSDLDNILLEEVKTIIESFFFQGPDMCLTYREICEGIDQGPGAAVNAKHNDFYSKLFNAKLSGTSTSLFALYEEAISKDPTWVAANNKRQSLMGHEIVAGSKLTFVPKYTDISRVICVEPILNMAFQKGISAVLKKALKRRVGIDLSTQPQKNQRLAQIGSEKGVYGTIDLESASDSISTGLVDLLFPSHVVRWLKIARSPAVTLPGDRNGPLELHMISSMGNDYTFPLQTMIFSAVVLAVYKVCGIKPINPRDAKPIKVFDRAFDKEALKNAKLKPTVRPPHSPDTLYWVPEERRLSIKRDGRLGNWAVFGDDIIVRREAYDRVVHLLGLFGFTVNKQKSFNTGLFRESCGTDWFLGQNVRGVYIKHLDTEHDVYSAINRLSRWCTRQGVLLPRAIAYLLSKVEFLPVPLEEQETHGIRIPFVLVRHALQSRDRDSNAVLYRTRVVRTRSHDVRESASFSRLDGYWENPEGHLVTVVAGKLRDGRLTPRLQSRSSRSKVGSSLSWDWSTAAQLEKAGYHEAFTHTCHALFWEFIPGRLDIPRRKRRSRKSVPSQPQKGQGRSAGNRS